MDIFDEIYMQLCYKIPLNILGLTLFVKFLYLNE